MNGGIVPLLLLGFSLGLMLTFAASRPTVVALATFAVAALIGFAIPTGAPSTVIFIGLWTSTIVVAATAYVPVARWPFVVIALSIVAGLWLGACAALTADLRGLVIGVALALTCYPAKWIAARKFDILIKVVASWMIAIASLSMFVSLMPTPGYKPDHME